MKQYVGIIRDHSASMGHLVEGAARDYNNNIVAIQLAAKKQQIDTIVSTVLCGIGPGKGKVKREVVNSNAHVLKPISDRAYKANGMSTPLFDSIGELIDLLTSVPDRGDPDVCFLCIIITDGEENASVHWHAASLSNKIKSLQSTDRWTFTFRVPRGYGYALSILGIHPGNILEWDQTQRGIEIASERNIQAINNYYQQRSKGVKSSSRFYADLSDVRPSDLKRDLADISNQITILSVARVQEIRSFIEDSYGGHYIKGAGFYELTKPETIQDYKKVVIKDKMSGKFYGGSAARQMLGLPDFGSVRLHPGDHGQYDIFIQSTSVNRKLMPNTRVVYWKQGVL